MENIFKKLFSKKFVKKRNVYIGGIKIENTLPYPYNDKVWYINHFHSYRNMVKAFKNLKIRVKIEHYICDGDEILAILTAEKNPDRLISSLESIKNVVLTAFPDYTISPLEGNEIEKLLNWNRINGEYSEFGINFLYEHSFQGYKPRNIFRLPIQADGADRVNIRIGRILDTNKYYYIGLESLTNHLTCLGATGMGKTTTISTILNQLPEDIGYIVLDYHNEYHRLLKNYDIIVRPGEGGTSINPFKQYYEDLEDTVAILTDIFSEIYNFTHSQAYYFKNVLEATFNNHIMVGEEEPNINAFIKILEEYPIKSYSEHETKAALLRRFKQLSYGQAAKIFVEGRNIDITEIMDKKVIVELGHVHELYIKKILGYIILKNIFNIQKNSGSKHLQHITVIEEARYLLPARREYDQPSIAEKIVDEIRKFGESIFIISQFPSQLAKAPIKNSGVLIIHRISGAEDLWYIKNVVSLNDEQLEYLKQLDVGEALIKDNVNPLPFPVSVERV